MRFLISALLIFSGVGIYILCRQDVLFLLPFVNSLPDEMNIIANGSFISRIIVFNLPDALWYGALLIIQSNPYLTGLNLLTVLLLGLPFIHEIMQGLNLLPGTFDLLDLFAYIITLLIFLTLWKKEKNSQNAEDFNFYV